MFIAVEIHQRRHVFFNYSLEAFSRGVLIEMTLHEVFHHGDEFLVAVLSVIHHPSEHVKNVTAFGVNKAVVSSGVFECIESESHPDRSGIVRAAAPLILIQYALAMSLPELQIFVRLLLGEVQV